MADTKLDQRIAAVRRFNRLYTKQIGLLHEGYMDTPFSLAEVRVLYELAHRDQLTAAGLGKELGMDAGYLSRIVRGFERRGFVKRTASKADGRQSLLSLTRRGRDEFSPVQARTGEQVGAWLGRLPVAEQQRLVQAMASIEGVLGARPEPKAAAVVLRPPLAGDMGWVVQRHGALYAQEYGWDERFEALVATIVARFIERFDAKRERCWIAEKDGEPVGSVFVVRQSATVAKLRLLIVEPGARGLGIGQRLVAECVRFARQCGYRKVSLWTNSILVAARGIYKAAGFRLVHQEPHTSFGHDLIAETWELTL